MISSSLLDGYDDLKILQSRVAANCLADADGGHDASHETDEATDAVVEADADADADTVDVAARDEVRVGLAGVVGLNGQEAVGVAPSSDARCEGTKVSAPEVVSLAGTPELGTARRLAGQITGSALKCTGALARGIARVREEGLVTHIYCHQPSAQQFHGCLTWLLNRGYVPVSTADIMAAQSGDRPLPALALHVSLDDAFRSNLTEVVPVAQDLGVPITVFVPTEPVERGWYWWSCVERMAKDEYRTVERLKEAPNAERLEAVAAALRRFKPQREAMTIEELRSVAGLSHVTIGSHTVSHPILTQCSDAELERELVASRERLERWIGKPVNAFAYPNGTFGEREAEAVQRAGYAVAFTVEQRHAQAVEGDPLRLPRLALTNNGPLIENLCRAVGIWHMPNWQPWRAKKVAPLETRLLEQA